MVNAALTELLQSKLDLSMSPPAKTQIIGGFRHDGVRHGNLDGFTNPVNLFGAWPP